MKQRFLTIFCCVALCISLIFSTFCFAGATSVWGDMNQDGLVNMKDILCLRKYMTHISNTNAQDLDGDGLIDMKDILVLRKYMAHLIDEHGNSITTTTTKKTTTTTKKTTAKAASTTVKEMRGVWVAYYEVSALMKSTPDATKTAIDTLMKNIQSYGANAVFWHCRAYSDAYYKSSYFPQNSSVVSLIKAGFDPLTYAVSSAHSHGLEFHAWINPYRVGKTLSNAKCSDTFLFDGKYYYSPASSAARTLIINGAKELAKNYAIDGIHLDDYFYPEGISTSKQSFDIGYTSGSVGDFRRKQVDTLVKNLYSSVHAIKSKISMGISPGGTIAKDRNNMYADVEKWISNAGYIDYICPQIYFGIEHQTAAFETRMKEWCAVPRASGVKMYIGLAVYKAGLLSDTYAGTGKTEWANHSNVLAREVQLCRKRSDVQGFVLFSYRYMNLSAFDSSTNNVTIAKKEISNLIAEIKK